MTEEVISKTQLEVIENIKKRRKHQIKKERQSKEVVVYDYSVRVALKWLEAELNTKGEALKPYFRDRLINAVNDLRSSIGKEEFVGRRADWTISAKLHKKREPKDG